MSEKKDGYENTTAKLLLYEHEKKMAHGVVSRIIFRLIKCIALFGQRIPLVRKGLAYLESCIFPGKMYDSFFKKYAPDGVVVSSLGYMIDPYFMRAARRHGSRVISIIHNWDHPTMKGYRGALPDNVVAWNESMKREVSIFHDIPKDKIFIGGIAHWDFYFNGRYRRLNKTDFISATGLKRERKIIFYGTSNYLLFQRTFDIVEGILKAIESSKISPPSQLLVRLHPAYMMKEAGRERQVVEHFQSKIDRIKERYRDLVIFNYPAFKVLNDDIDMSLEDLHGLAHILSNVDIMLTEYSTLLIEAAIFDLPVVNVGLYNYRDTNKPAAFLENFTHLRRILKYGSIKNAYTFEELFKFINEYLENRALEREQRKRLVDNEIPIRSGDAGKRIGKYLSKVF